MLGCCTVACVGALLALLAILYHLWRMIAVPPRFIIAGSHILITGGSLGIGLATAIQLAKLKAKITIVARNQRVLNEAVMTIISAAGGAGADKNSVQGFSADVSDPAAIANAVKQATDNFGPFGAVILSAGICRPGIFEEIPNQVFVDTINTNYLGMVYTLKAIIPSMKQRQSGRIILVSSVAGLMGVMGFTPYCPTKFAVRGLAESLHMELKPFNIQVSLANPPNVDTPMLAGEEPYKPEACKMLCNGFITLSASEVALGIVDNLTNWSFFIQNRFPGIMAGILCQGNSPASSIKDELIHLVAMGAMRFMSLAMSNQMDQIIRKYTKIDSATSYLATKKT